MGYNPWGLKESDTTERLTLLLSNFNLCEVNHSCFAPFLMQNVEMAQMYNQKFKDSKITYDLSSKYVSYP